MARLEVPSEKPLLEALRTQGFFATKTVDRFRAGRPDWRIGRTEYGQIDIEYKYCQLDGDELSRGIVETGIRKLQVIKIKELNDHGMPAVGMVYLPLTEEFVFTNVLRDNLTGSPFRIKKLPKPVLIHGGELFHTAMEYLRGLGYQHR